jgi:S1-C subfamily serine protease
VGGGADVDVDGGTAVNSDGTTVTDSDGGARPAATGVAGVLITDLAKRGTAARQGLKVNDVILRFNGVRTPTFTALADAVQQASGRAEVVYLDGETGEQQTLVLYPENGRIGVTGEDVQVE